MKVKCLIVDDEQYARKLLAGYIAKLPELEFAGEAKNAMDALSILHTGRIDLMFLDIQMPDLSGVDLLKSLNHKPVVIFTTAFREYAIEGYELDVIDYMLKPVSFERFIQGVNKAIEFIKLKWNPVTDGELGGGEVSGSETIILKADSKLHRIRIDDIKYVEGLREYVTYYTDARKYIVLESLKNIENKLPKRKFMRVHKSYIVNVAKIDTLHGNTIIIGETEIPVGKSFASDVRQQLFRTG